jgi:Na+/H+ antiporter NhaC
MRPTRFRLAAVLAAPLLLAQAASAQAVVEAPRVVLRDVPFEIVLAAEEAEGGSYEVRDAKGAVLATGALPGPGESVETVDLPGLRISDADQLPLSVMVGGVFEPLSPTLVPGWFSLLPPLVAILMALIFREVITALVAGVWIGALAVAGFDPLAATWRVMDAFVVPALGDVASGHTQIVVFSLVLGGMVGVISRNGGTMGIVEAVTPFARTARRGRLVAWLAGLAIFFDDYANTLIVGTSLRPITDRLRVSREKLAYIVDSTAAPVAALVPLSTWVGYEISLIADGLRVAGEQQSSLDPAAAQVLLDANPFTVFIHTIPYRFYPLLALIFVLLTVLMNRDIGPMARAEKRATAGEGLYRPGAQLAEDAAMHIQGPKEGVRHRWWNAALPIVTMIGVVLAGLWVTGRTSAGPDASLMEVFGEADPFETLLWGSTAGAVVAFALSVGARLLTVTETVDAFVGGVRAMLVAMVVLVLAWSLGAMTEELGTAPYLGLVLEGNVALRLLPALVFLTAAAMSFATGASWGTMAILVPLVIPLSVSLGGGIGFETGGYSLLLGTISSVLAGAIFGDHCSPISDTTVLSSTA